MNITKDNGSENAKLAVKEILELIATTAEATDKAARINAKAKALQGDECGDEGSPAEVYDRAQRLQRDREICKIEVARADEEMEKATMQLRGAVIRKVELIIEVLKIRRQQALEEVTAKLEPLMWPGGWHPQVALNGFALVCYGVGDRSGCIHRLVMCHQAFMQYGSSVEALTTELKTALELL
jgi:hypothetical protein